MAYVSDRLARAFGVCRFACVVVLARVVWAYPTAVAMRYCLRTLLIVFVMVPPVLPTK